MSNLVEADICVIGGGSGGLSVAAGAVQMGAKVVLIEKGKMGGDCLNYGCVPSKALIAAGKHAHAMGTGAPFGVKPQPAEVDFAKVHDHVHGVIAHIAPVDSVERFEGLGVNVIQAPARFLSSGTVDAGGTTVKARRFVIATGSSAAVPPIPGLDSVPYLTNETVFDLKEAPEHLIVIGGGPIGMELAQAHRRLGAKVTVLEGMKALGKDDPELTALVLDVIHEDGIELREGASVTRVSGSAGHISVTFKTENGEESVAGSHLLLAVGRRPNLDGLDLENAGVAYERTGIKVDARLRTTNKNIYAIGDVAGGLQFTHVAGYHAGIVIRNILFRLPAKADHSNIPWATYTDPELAHVGETEEQARAKHGKIEVLRWPLAENDRAQAERNTRGMAKVITDTHGRILGASIVGPHAGDLLQPWVLAKSQGLKISAMAGMVAPYPTLGEISKRAAGSYYTPTLFSWKTRLVVKLLSKLG
ncbi:MAG: mercuric reductase [Alphaproteobacteria bacterium]|nr:mercuric reductase [Alphaproteobacteria bacterium]MBO6627555.1 mercuric reductase [Alphaproteobacteria bacterium]MDF1627828.1 mercuric reductase [Parvibaculaceae bacterium]